MYTNEIKFKLKFHGHWSTGSGEEVLKVFTIYGRGGHFGHVTWTV